MLSTSSRMNSGSFDVINDRISVFASDEGRGEGDKLLQVCRSSNFVRISPTYFATQVTIYGLTALFCFFYHSLLYFL